ncbi:Phosphomevalonate kinase [Metschnikowia bicuspidata var. bicuspidata NRRL YB-4993]|uniref:Phosphomevalonate kinase n=1 Tax=Metschnikowia bicuspidata var. bicuspidata NRRL YB-4993 TaxID=869754 RepID=A0A1A0HE16_9ASCO|nr:Phosphomevalonate kinase [Metschnikowia bicuspidata var. bicuspidata NRRL YB-4993]OBA22256.1 Phosphomevalonate kinase [Metschnikowia bicuspidata var. bicuspidata NRRL YB-4993]
MTRVFGAPGKALVAGGYLVLDPEYNSYVTALSSRMHARIQLDPVTDTYSKITVSSPQFNGFWEYTIAHDTGFFKTKTRIGGRNPFIEETVKVLLAYVEPQKLFNFQITLFSDPGFHTQDDTEQRYSDNSKKMFLYHKKPIEQVSKTGMGLSAGLVSVVSAALLATFLAKPASDIIHIIHNVSQIAHCGAQGKIGSGFDVAAAVYGSIIYRRFSPMVISEILDQQFSSEYCASIKKIVNTEWDFVHSSCSLPPGLRLIMGDVNGGSETPRLVSQVLNWRNKDEDSVSVYETLNLANCRFMAELQKLNEFSSQNPSKYKQELEAGTLFMNLSNCIAAIREGLQLLTSKSGADIEPPEQKHLLDKCEELPGCLGGVVPGAGGYDAICLLVDSSQVANLKQTTRLDESFASVTWLELTEESQGIVEELAEDYFGL